MIRVPTALFALLLSAVPQDGEAADPVAAAQARLDEHRAEREAAHEDLESLALELEDDYRTLTAGEGAAAARQALVLAMLDALPAARSRIAAEEAQGRAVLRGSRRRILEDAFEQPVRAASPVDPRLALHVASGVADEIARRSDLAVGEDELLAALAQVLDPELNWWEFWNAGFHETLDASRRYANAVQLYEEAGLELERLRHPERFGPRGERAPPGMVIVPGGSYELGPNTGWARARRKVTLRPFALDRHEVTHAEYALFVDARPESARRDLLPRGWRIAEDGSAEFDPERADHPVAYVSWEQAAAYAAWAGKRLPTEDEWEAAAAGIDGRVYPWGDTFLAHAVNGGNGAGDTTPVESFPEGRSAAGCYDMAGNVEEWTATTEDGRDVDELPEGLVNIVFRGGSFRSRRDELTTRYRWTAPGRDTFSSPRYTRPIGFRCAKDLR